MRDGDRLDKAIARNRTRRAIVIGDEIWGDLSELAAKEGKSVSELVREAVWNLVQSRKRQNYDPVQDRFSR